MNETRACDVLAYAAAAAKEMHLDPSVYAAHRLLATMERLLGFLIEEGCDDAFYTELRQLINDQHVLVMTDHQAFGELIDEVVQRVALKSFASP